MHTRSIQSQRDDAPHLADIFWGLSHPDRIEILRQMRAARARGVRALSITTIAEHTELTRFAASRHLAILWETGFVTMTRSGTTKLCSLNHYAFERIDDWIADALE